VEPGVLEKCIASIGLKDDKVIRLEFDDEIRRDGVILSLRDERVGQRIIR
jgi:hypothetical protein